MATPVYGTQPISMGPGEGTRDTQPIYGQGSPYGVGPQGRGQSTAIQQMVRDLLFGVGGWMLGGPPGALGGLMLGRQGGLFGGDQGPSPTQVQAERIQAGLEETGPTRPLGARALGGALASPESFETWLGGLPRDLADAAVVSAEQNAAMNAINRQQFQDWQNLMRGAYGEAMGALGQTRGMYA